MSGTRGSVFLVNSSTPKTYDLFAMLPYCLPPYFLEHYPEGLKGRYVASPSPAARLGRGRVFASRSEYAYFVSADRKYHSRRRAREVAPYILEQQALWEARLTHQATPPFEFGDEDDGSRVAIDDLEDAARHRRRVWSGVDPTEVRSATPQFLVNIRRWPRHRSRPTWSGVRQCVRTEEESAEVIARIADWQSTSTLTADRRELGYPSAGEAAADSDIWVKVEYDELDPSVLFASPPSRPGTQPPASPSVQVLSHRPSFFADSPLPGAQPPVSASSVRVRIESEEPRLSDLAPASPFLIKSEPQSVDNLVLLSQQSQTSTPPSPVPPCKATSPVQPRPIPQRRIKSEPSDESIIFLRTPCRVDSPQVVPSLQPAVAAPFLWRVPPRRAPPPSPIVPFWKRADEDVTMGEEYQNDLWARVVEPLRRPPGPAFSSFSAFAAAAAPQVGQRVPASPRVRIESRSEEDLADLHRWHEGEPAPGPGPTTTKAPAPEPQEPATPASLFGGEDSDDEDEPIITAVKPAPEPKGRKARKAREVQVKQESTQDALSFLDDIAEEYQFMNCAPPENSQPPQVQTVSQAPEPRVVQRRPTSPLCSPRVSGHDVEMDESLELQHTGLPHAASVIRPLIIAQRAVVQPRVREARSQRVEKDIKMEVEDIQVTTVRQPLRRSRKANIPVKSEPMETTLAFNEEVVDAEDAELLRELHAMQRDAEEWYRQPPASAPAPVAAKSEPVPSDDAALANVRVESEPFLGFDYSPEPAHIGPLVKVESESGTYELSNRSTVSASTSDDSDICSLTESFARLSIRHTSEVLYYPSSLGESDSVVSYLTVEDPADVGALESAGQEVPLDASSGVAPLVKEEQVGVSLSTLVLASNATAVCTSPRKQIIIEAESEEEVHLPHTGQQSALLLRASAVTSSCPFDGEPPYGLPQVSLPHPSHPSGPYREDSHVDPAPSDAPASEPPVQESSQEKTSSSLAASASVFAAFVQRCTDAFYAQHPRDEDCSGSEDEAMEIYELYEALPTHDVRNVEVQLIANDLVDSRSAHAITSSAEYQEALEDTLSIYGVKPGQSPETAPKLPAAVAIVLPSHFRYPDALSRRPHGSDLSSPADAVQSSSGAPPPSSCPVSRDLKQRARDSFWANWSRSCVQELGIIPCTGEDGELGFEVYEGESPLPVVLSSHELYYYEPSHGPTSLGAPVLLAADDEDQLAATCFTPATSAATATEGEDNREDKVLAGVTGPTDEDALSTAATSVGEDDEDTGSDTIRPSSDEDSDSWHCPIPRSDKGKARILFDILADDIDEHEDDLGFDIVSHPEDDDTDSVMSVASSSHASSPRARYPQIRLRLPNLRRHAPSPASSSASVPRTGSSLPRATSGAASLIRRCLGLKTR
ncbi:hypothetical protein LXA43DRAFT_1179151 [Ganoderma leucocontextum]|nr:hypothetical protein LXA43DRAFT_1179151 [Ganoderma leucocontextum]